MFKISNSILSPEAEGSAAPASSSSPASSSTPSTLPANTAGNSIPNTDALFKDFESKLVGNSQSKNQNSYEDDDAFGQEVIGQPMDAESIDNIENEVQAEETAAVEEDDGLPLYVYKDKIGNDDIELVIENKDQLHHYLKRAAMAPKIYEENKILKSEMSKYQKKASIADEFDRMAKEEPLELLNMLIEEIGDEKLLSDWANGLRANLDQSEEQRQYFKKLREAEYIKQQWERQREAQTKLESDRKAAIEEQNVQVVSNWRSNEFSKWESKVDPAHHEVLQQIIDAQIMYASHMAAAGKDVDLHELSGRIYKAANALVGNQKQINQKIGKATQAARQQATSKLQAATTQVQSSRAQQAGKQQGYKSTDDAFKDLMNKINTGDIRLRS